MIYVIMIVKKFLTPLSFYAINVLLLLFYLDLLV